jgi:hypothetical protein
MGNMMKPSDRANRAMSEPVDGCRRVVIGGAGPRRRAAQGDDQDHRTPRRAVGALRLPVEHWVHLRATNAIWSTFAAVRLWQRVTEGPAAGVAGIAMAFTLIESVQGVGGGP